MKTKMRRRSMPAGLRARTHLRRLPPTNDRNLLTALWLMRRFDRTDATDELSNADPDWVQTLGRRAVEDRLVVAMLKVLRGALAAASARLDSRARRAGAR